MSLTHILTPFNGMKSGFKSDGSQSEYSAQITTLKGVFDFTTQNLASKPIYLFGYFQMLYDAPGNNGFIEVKFSLPAKNDFAVNLFVTVSVTGSQFIFSGIDANQTAIASDLGENTLPINYAGNATGEYVLNVYPAYHQDLTTFILTKIEIVTK